MTALGKIAGCKFGRGGYDNAMVGWSFHLESKAGSSIDFWGYWAHRSKDAKWTEESREALMGKYTMQVVELLSKAKKESLEELVGVPIEITWEGFNGRLLSWRVLEEVL